MKKGDLVWFTPDDIAVVTAVDDELIPGFGPQYRMRVIGETADGGAHRAGIRIVTDPQAIAEAAKRTHPLFIKGWARGGSEAEAAREILRGVILGDARES